MVATATAQTTFNTSGYAKARENDSYIYQVGFGNTFASQAIPGVLPEGQNSPQKCKYGLYAEQITGSPFTSPRAQNQRSWLYRIRPSVAHDGISLTKQNPFLESDFSLSNPKVHINPTQVAWRPVDLPSAQTKVDFIQGLKTLSGSGSAISKDGYAFHLYAASTSMGRTALVNNDGDFLFVPEHGRLDIQTEFGRMMVAPGEIAVVPCGIKFKISLPDGPVRGTLHEVFGHHFSLPELGAIGANGMANVRDFEHPVASFDIDQSAWSLIYKVGGKLFECKQDHTPFDIVAWHGNYVPYKYALDKFIILRNVNKDHTDPSTMCVLTVKSKWPGIPLVDFCAAQTYMDVTVDTFRPEWYHRNCASEFVSFIRGGPGAGGMLGYTGFTPHGPDVDRWAIGVSEELTPKVSYPDTLLVLAEPYQPMLLTDYAVKSNGYTVLPRKPFTDLPAVFLDNLDEVNAGLASAGLPLLGQ